MNGKEEGLNGEVVVYIKLVPPQVSSPVSYLCSVLSDFTLRFFMFKQAPQKEKVCNSHGITVKAVVFIL